MNKTAICIGLLLSSQAWALSCTTPVTLSQPGQVVKQPEVAINEEGEALVLWRFRDSDNNTRTLAAATMDTEKKWVSAAISSSAMRAYRYFPFIDAKGNSFVLWQSSIESDEGTELFYHFAKKEKNKHWTPGVKLLSSEDTLKYPTNAFDAQGNVLFFGNTQKSAQYMWGETGTVVALNYLHMTSEKKQTEFTTSGRYLESRRLIRNEEGDIFAIWNEKEESRTMGAWLQSDGSWSAPITIPIHSDYLTNKAAMNAKKDLAIVYASSNAMQVVTCFNGQWSEPMQLDVVDKWGFDKIRIVLNDEGDVVVSWQKEEKRKNTISVADKPKGMPWSSPIVLSDSAKSDELRLSIDQQGNAMVVWLGKEGIKRVPFAAYKPVNQAWVSPIPLTDGAKTCNNPQLEVNNLGYFAIIWEDHQIKHISIHGATFSTATQQWTSSQISPQGQDCGDFTFKFNKKGQGIIAWKMYGDQDFFIQAAELNVN